MARRIMRCHSIHVVNSSRELCESCSVVSDSLQPHGLYSPQDSPGQNTGLGSLSGNMQMEVQEKIRRREFRNHQCAWATNAQSGWSWVRKVCHVIKG